MLPQKMRVHKYEFGLVLKNKRFFHCPYFYIAVSLLNSSKKMNPNQFSAVVSSKICKKAVERNLLRRRMNAAANDFIIKNKIGMQIIMFAKKGAETLDYSSINKEISLLFQKLN